MAKPRRSRSTRSRSRSRSRSHHAPRRKSATKLRLFSAPTGTMPERTRAINVKVRVGRNKFAAERGHAFMACVTFGKQTECSESSNPSAAVGHALAKVGNHVANRPSSFAGLQALAGRRRRRRSRR